MASFIVHILGCGSALPTLRHSASSQVVELHSKTFMLDCGEGTQLQMRKSRLSFNKIRAIFITHLHGDHWFGLLGLISTFDMLGRTAPLQIYAPATFVAMLDSIKSMLGSRPGYAVEFHPVDTERQAIIYDDRSLTVETVPLEHRIPCCGYLLREKPTLPHIRRDMIDFYEIPYNQIKNIKNGADWTTPSGETVPHDRLISPATPTRSYAYCTDTRYIPTLHSRVAGVTVLYHESTYDDACAERAKLYHHSTATQAALVARDAHAGKLGLGHFSARYDNEQGLLREAQAVFPNSILAHEGLIVEV